MKKMTTPGLDPLVFLTMAVFLYMGVFNALLLKDGSFKNKHVDARRHSYHFEQVWF